MGIYFLLGLLYVLFNVYVRKLNTDSSGLVILWFFAWPLFLFLFAITTIGEKLK